MRRALLFHAVLLMSVNVLVAQVEHVQTSHPVYSFLQRMYVRGLIKGYSESQLPLDRSRVAQLVREAGANGARMSESERELFARFDDEFGAELDGTQKSTSVFAPGTDGTLGDALFGDHEKYLYKWTSDDRSTTFVAEFLGSLDARAGRIGGSDRNVLLGQVGGRFRGTIARHFGYVLQSTNGESFGDKDLALRDNDLRLNTNFGDLNRNFFDFTEAYVAAQWSWGSASFGRERVLSGMGYACRTLLSTNAPAFDAVRFEVHSGVLRFSFLHGSLLGTHDTIENYRPYYDAKYIAMHRVEADLFDAVRVGVSEAVVYSERAFDFAYINPVNFFKSAEHAGGDRDNPMLGFDIQTMPLHGMQLYGSLLIDDVDFAKWGTGWYGDKFVWQAGAMSSALIKNTDITIEYARVEPYTFTHLYRNNEYTNKGVALGMDVPPNSDRWTLGIKHWIGGRITVSAQVWFQRHGLNEYDATGAVVKNNGGKIDEPFVAGRDSQNASFLEGPREETWTGVLGLRWEPVRNHSIQALLRVMSICHSSTDRIFALRYELDL
jgi:hypothetical protein